MNEQRSKMTACQIPFSAALDGSAWREFLKRFTNQIDCTHCKREFTQDTETRRWYPSEACLFGRECSRSDEVHPVETQRGWFCGEECHGEHLAKIEEAA